MDYTKAVMGAFSMTQTNIFYRLKERSQGEIMKVHNRIDRSKWITATHGEGDVRLLNDHGFMCCLGFRALAEGFNNDEILGCRNPNHLCELTHKPFDKFVLDDVHTAFSLDAISINDNDRLTDQEREQELIKLAKEHSEVWEFYGEYSK